MDKYCETKLISKMDIYFETDGVVLKVATNSTPRTNFNFLSLSPYTLLSQEPSEGRFDWIVHPYLQGHKFLSSLRMSSSKSGEKGNLFNFITYLSWNCYYKLHSCIVPPVMFDLKDRKIHSLVF